MVLSLVSDAIFNALVMGMPFSRSRANVCEKVARILFLFRFLNTGKFKAKISRILFPILVFLRNKDPKIKVIAPPTAMAVVLSLINLAASNTILVNSGRSPNAENIVSSLGRRK
ncbi:MAG: hypothetical protein AMQ74_01851 [Candidatus Methanofastidiosum methylothiophilum]|uniref:Uncharacterized protein n=1 Tax=Candidatus Methanofastidiosum methylothiophilum TaxID=1705564 RepID=A0A150IN01_9EURY|nr:MAG: hypothetical protein AMQ74_01851 [Candidatus Methanofastidiosum methylthiophilus]